MADIPVYEGLGETLVTITADGQSVVAFDFLAFSADQVKAEYRPASGAMFPLVLNTHYTVAGLNQPNGGTITLSGFTRSVNDQVYIYRETPIERENDWQNEGDYKADLVNREQDEIYMIMQELKRSENNNNSDIDIIYADLKKEISDRENADAALASLINQSGPIEVPVYDTVLSASFAEIKEVIKSIRVSGDSEPGDGNNSLYIEVENSGTLLVDEFLSNGGNRRWKKTGRPILVFATGQSNIAFHKPLAWVPPKNLYLWDWDGMSDPLPSVGTEFVNVPNDNMALSYSFGAEVAKSNPASKVYVVNVGKGSLPISHWLPGSPTPDMYYLGKANIEAAISVIGEQPEIIHLWWQGENDAFAASNTYVNDFVTYRDRLEQEAWFPHTTRGLIMGVSYYTTPAEADAMLRDFSIQLAKASASRPDVLMYVHTPYLESGYWDPDDGGNKIHMTGNGYRAAGRLAYEAYQGGNRSQSKNTFNDPSTGYFLSNSPSFLVRHSSALTGPALVSGWTIVDHNTGGHFNATNGLFSAPVEGLYQLGFKVGNNATGGAINVVIYKNGSPLGGTEAITTTGYETIGTSINVMLKRGDVLGLFISAGTSINSNVITMFYGTLLG